MANARPVISTAVAAVVDLLGAASSRDAAGYEVCDRGISVKSGDAEAFAAGIKRLVNDESLRREPGLRGLQFVERHYSKDRLLNDVRNLYDELLKLEPANVKVPASKPHVESRF